MSVDATVVVCTRNRAESLPPAIGSLLTQQTRGAFTFEILVVDNGSTDRTADVVDEIAARSSIRVRRVYESQPGVAFARNCGVREAAGNWIAFFDDDQLADERWLAELLALAVEKNTLCVGGAVNLHLPAGYEVGRLSHVCRMLLGETVDMPTVRPYSPTLTPGCGNLMVHRDAFESIGLFDERLNSRGEDTDLYLRIHREIGPGWYTPRAIVHHVIPAERMTADYLLRLSDKMAEGMAEDERNTWGRLFPLVWTARVGQAGLVLWPRMLWAKLTGNRERLLGARCRMRIARGYLRDGLELMFPKRRESGKSPESRDRKEEASRVESQKKSRGSKVASQEKTHSVL